MENLEHAFAALTDGALVFVRTGREDVLIRPAAFVFETPSGLLWVEPAYADPNGSPGFAMHEREGKVVRVGSEFRIERSDGEVITVTPYYPEAGDGDLVGGALEWFAQWLKREDRTWAEERERVRQLIS